MFRREAMDTLFPLDAQPTGMAAISDCGLYRYNLMRHWSGGEGQVNFVMLNPSKADATTDDPTLRRCVGYAKAWGFGSLVITNLYALCATDPKCLWRCDDPVGRGNDDYLIGHAISADLVVCAWGANARPGRVAEVVRAFDEHEVRRTVLRMTAKGQPCHPLFLPGGLVPVPWAELVEEAA